MPTSRRNSKELILNSSKKDLAEERVDKMIENLTQELKNVEVTSRPSSKNKYTIDLKGLVQDQDLELNAAKKVPKLPLNCRHEVSKRKASTDRRSMETQTTSLANLDSHRFSL